MNLLDKFHHWRRKRRWNKQYRSGRWDSLQSDKEVKRYQTIAAFIAENVSEKPDVLDIGCGDGVLNLRMGKEAYRYFLGVDFSEVSIKKARARQLPNSEFEVADAISFVPPKSFDVIIFNEVFYYIHNSEKQRVLDRMLSHLNPQGILIISIYREGEGCWEYFKENSDLEEVAFGEVRTNEETRYWKIGAYKLKDN